jgi:hypothetical protein
VQLQQLDGKLVWCDLKELASNCSCMLLAHNPVGLPVVKSAKRLDGSSIPRQYLLSVECAEPVRLLSCLCMGPQHPALPPPPVAKKVSLLFVLLHHYKPTSYVLHVARTGQDVTEGAWQP